MELLVPTLAFYLLVLVLCVVRPGAGRVFVGAFFLVMALGINIVLVFVAPELFVALGTSAPLIPLYSWFFGNVVALTPALFGLSAVAYEVTIALMMLSKGWQVRWGLIGGIVFLIAITPLGVWTLANPILAVAMAYLLSGECDRDHKRPGFS